MPQPALPQVSDPNRDKWLGKRQQELLPVGYYRLVFSVPHTLVPLMWQNKRRLFALLFEASDNPIVQRRRHIRPIGGRMRLYGSARGIQEWSSLRRQ